MRHKGTNVSISTSEVRRLEHVRISTVAIGATPLRVSSTRSKEVIRDLVSADVTQWGTDLIAVPSSVCVLSLTCGGHADTALMAD